MGAKLDTLFYGFDTTIFSIFGSIQTDFLNYVAKGITFFGSAYFAYFIIFLSVILCIFKKTRRYGVPLLISLLIGVISTNYILKPSIMRLRPYLGLQDTPFWEKYEAWHLFAGSVTESNYSFPSGHTTLAFSASAPLFITGVKQKNKWMYLTLIFAVLIAFSRIYLMVHYPSDVLFGFIVGVIAGTLGCLIAKLIFKEKHIKDNGIPNIIETNQEK